MITEQKKILIVEDDFNFGNILKDYLILNDYFVVLAKNGVEGMEKFQNENFRITLSVNYTIVHPGRTYFMPSKFFCFNITLMLPKVLVSFSDSSIFIPVFSSPLYKPLINVLTVFATIVL